MTVINGHISRPSGGQLTIEEVAVLLGVSKRADELYYLEDICTALSINIWSPFKPVRNTLKDSNLTLADMQAANYGFDLASIQVTGSTLADVARLAAAAGIAALGSWDNLYARPRGRLSAYVVEWYRLLDFLGYYHYAEAPYDSITPSGSGATRLITGIRVYRNSDAGASSIALEDLTGITSQVGRSIGDWRLGAIAKRGSSFTTPVVHQDTLDNCWIDDGTDIYADLPSLSVPSYGYWDVVVFITDYNPSDNPNAGNIYSGLYIPMGYASVNVPNPGPAPVTPDVYPGEIEYTPQYDQVDGDLIRLEVAAPFVVSIPGFEPEVTLHAALVYYDDSLNTWVTLAQAQDTTTMISSGDYCEPILSGFSYDANELYLDMWYQVDGDPKYYVTNYQGVTYEATTPAQRDALLQQLRTITVADILDEQS